MSAISKAIEQGRLFVITEKDLKNLLRNQALDMHNDRGRGLMTYEQAQDVLQLSESGFKKLLRDPDCLIKRSKIKGRVLAESVFDEVARLTNTADE